MDKKLVVTLFAVVIILLGLTLFCQRRYLSAKDSKADEISNKGDQTNWNR